MHMPEQIKYDNRCNILCLPFSANQCESSALLQTGVAFPSTEVGPIFSLYIETIAMIQCSKMHKIVNLIG